MKQIKITIDSGNTIGSDVEYVLSASYVIITYDDYESVLKDMEFSLSKEQDFNNTLSYYVEDVESDKEIFIQKNLHHEFKKNGEELGVKDISYDVVLDKKDFNNKLFGFNTIEMFKEYKEEIKKQKIIQIREQEKEKNNSVVNIGKRIWNKIENAYNEYKESWRNSKLKQLKDVVIPKVIEIFNKPRIEYNNKLHIAKEAFNKSMKRLQEIQKIKYMLLERWELSLKNDFEKYIYYRTMEKYEEVDASEYINQLSLDNNKKIWVNKFIDEGYLFQKDLDNEIIFDNKNNFIIDREDRTITYNEIPEDGGTWLDLDSDKELHEKEIKEVNNIRNNNNRYR